MNRSNLSIIETLMAAQRRLSSVEALFGADGQPIRNHGADLTPLVDPLPEEGLHDRMVMVGQAWDVRKAVCQPYWLGVANNVDFGAWVPGQKLQNGGYIGDTKKKSERLKELFAEAGNEERLTMPLVVVGASLMFHRASMKLETLTLFSAKGRFMTCDPVNGLKVFPAGQVRVAMDREVYTRFVQQRAFAPQHI